MEIFDFFDDFTISESVLPIFVFVIPILTVLYRKQRYISQLEKNNNNWEYQLHLQAINDIIAHGRMSKRSSSSRYEQSDTELFSSSSSSSHSMVVESTSDFLHQVAGHTCETLRKFHFKVLKPMVKPKLFRREIELYEEMQILGLHCTQVARAFVPKYYGVLNIQNSGSYLPYLVLKDLTISYMKPCVIDIKMGIQTYEPTASDEKKSREHEKYSYQKSIGFRITGFKVYDVTKSLFYSVNKSFGRSLKPEQIKDGFKLFFHNGKIFRREILVVIIQKLENILTWFRSQTKLHFYCSSILIVYDGYSMLDSGVSHHHHYGNRNHNNTTILTATTITNNNNNNNNSSSSGGNNNNNFSPFDCNPSTSCKHLNGVKPPVSFSEKNGVEKNGVGSMKEKYYVNGTKMKTGQCLHSQAPGSVTVLSSNDKPHKLLNYKPSPYEDIVQVRMIDFAHTLSSVESTSIPAIDEGYIIGVVNLINYLRSIVQDIDSGVIYNGVPDHLVNILKKSMTVSLE